MNRIVAILMVVALAGLASPVTAWAKNKPRPSQGGYAITVAGFGKGEGMATVAGDKIKLQANITAAAGGGKGQLTADNLTLTKNHFSGSGSVLGKPAKFKGRLDVPDSEDELAIRGVRMVCTVVTADGQYLRVIGFIPEQAKAKDKIDDDDDGGHGNRGKNSSGSGNN